MIARLSQHANEIQDPNENSGSLLRHTLEHVQTVNNAVGVIRYTLQVKDSKYFRSYQLI